MIATKGSIHYNTSISSYSYVVCEFPWCDHFKSWTHFSNRCISFKTAPPRRHLRTSKGNLRTFTIFNRKVNCYTVDWIRLIKKRIIKGKHVCDKPMSRYDSIQHCFTVHRKWQKLLDSTSRTSAFVKIKPDNFIPKIIMTILQLLPETSRYGNFKTMSMRSITAVSSNFGRQNIQHMERLFRKLVLQPSGFISWISPTKYFTVFFVSNFSSTKSFGSSGWVRQSTPSSQSSSPVYSTHSWVVNRK